MNEIVPLKTLIENLQFLMRKNNIKNISQLSKETNIPYTTLKGIFDGSVSDIRLNTSRKLSEYFKITLDELLFKAIALNNKDFKVENQVKDNIIYANSNKIDTKGLTEEEVEEINRLVKLIKNKNKQELNY